MPKSAFHTLLEEESELKQHDCVFKPETSSALEQNKLAFVACLKVNLPANSAVTLNEI